MKAAIVQRLGEGVLGPDGEIDRGKVGRIVFADRAELVWLEALLHPRVVSVYLRWREELAELEVPLLYETGGEARFDAVVAVTASTETRVGRKILPDAGLREQRLIPDEEKLRRADFAFVNEGSLEELDAFVAGVVEELSRRE